MCDKLNNIKVTEIISEVTDDDGGISPVIEMEPKSCNNSDKRTNVETQEESSWWSSIVQTVSDKVNIVY